MKTSSSTISFSDSITHSQVMSSSSPLFSSLGRYMDQCSSYVTLKFRIQHKCRFTWEIPYIAPWAYPVTPALCPKTCWTPTATFIRYFAKEAKDQGDVQKDAYVIFKTDIHHPGPESDGGRGTQLPGRRAPHDGGEGEPVRLPLVLPMGPAHPAAPGHGILRAAAALVQAGGWHSEGTENGTEPSLSGH